MDVVAVGITAGSRYENTALPNFRCIATNKKIAELFVGNRGSLGDEEIIAIKNKGIFLDLFSSDKLEAMRMSTWYREATTGEPVRIMLTVEGERKVRRRFGLPCPDTPTEPIAANAAAPASPVREKKNIAFELSPGTAPHVRTLLSSSSSGSNQPLEVPAGVVVKLRRGAVGDAEYASDRLGHD